jgi:hypothetical protein
VFFYIFVFFFHKKRHLWGGNCPPTLGCRQNVDGKTSHHGCQGNCKAVQIKNRVSGLGPTHKTFREDDRN